MRTQKITITEHLTYIQETEERLNSLLKRNTKILKYAKPKF